MKNQYRGGRKRSLRQKFCFFHVTLLAVVAGSAAAAPVVHLEVQAQPQAAQVVEEYWTPERMETAAPMPILEVPTDSGDRDAAVPQRGERVWSSEAPPGVALGWSPAEGPRPGPQPTIELTPEDFEIDWIENEAEAQTSPPFRDPPFSPDDFSRYAPFQRWTWFGSYLSYPISTIGKLFFRMDIDGEGNLQDFVCSGAVIGEHTVATAGHCLHNGLDGEGANNGWATDVLFCPSYNRGGVHPARGCWSGIAMVVSSRWRRAHSWDRDYACIVSDPQGGVNSSPIGNETGVLGRAWNWPTRQPTLAWGYPAGKPFPGYHIVTVASTEWYEVSMDPSDKQVSKYIGSDMTGGASGGPWWFAMSHPSFAFEYEDTDGTDITNPRQGFEGAPFLNGVNSHKGHLDGSPFTQEMGSPQFRSTPADDDESEDIFAECFSLN